MRIWLFLLSALILGVSFESNAVNQTGFDCWDGSFAYNYSSLVEKPDGYEFGINGSSFAKLTFPYQNIIFDGYHERAGIYFKFAQSECHSQHDTITCEASIDPLSENPLYIEREIRTLKGFTETITPVNVRLVSVEFNSVTKRLNMSVNTYVANPLNEQFTQNTSINMEYCEADGSPRAPFPFALREYLAGR